MTRSMIMKSHSDRGEYEHAISIDSSHSQHKPWITANSKLHFLSLVEVQLIPLCLAIGPSSDVQSLDQGTHDWFTQAIWPQEVGAVEAGSFVEPWWRNPCRQSDRGLLLKVQGEREPQKKLTKVTEVLIYATVGSHNASDLTVRTSPSPGPVDRVRQPLFSTSLPPIKLLALPLCSAILQRIPSNLPSPEVLEEGQAHFLPDKEKVYDGHAKRRNISLLFEDATKKRRNIKHKGGESVAKFMAMDRPASQQGLSQPQIEVEEADPALKTHLGHRKTLSRAKSDGLLSNRASTVRPLSSGKRSSLHRVESAYTPREDAQSPQTANDILEQNKAALSKMVMAGMRLHGLQQRQRTTKVARSRSSSVIGGLPTDENEDREYKLVYHQTFKAVMFAFRMHCDTRTLNQEAMREMVDKLLDTFCTDPMSTRPGISGFSPDHNGQDVVAENPFDLPSSSAQAADQINEWSAPPTKKRKPVASFEPPG
ncbi:uncharacterized protein KY384_003539 [Bacidia gigantensis]|uniref:uncharacterized protein n=1 Tax=Bacidia gigantensis TaxID=2732470 RepID=UPI001D059836|nr:uncharacterized protein KY384_003539 [Bacidia gigantensis]KAG8531903.1 hypothetical protein KY384_003539 [Bacidia gigantensis]